jgi:mRNA-degrading endonuclease RelE of RelBE toxin-antitoxin system
MKLVFLRSALKFLKNCEFNLQVKIKKEIDKIAKTPESNKILQGALYPIRVHQFFFQRTQYRIAYYIKDNVIIILIGTRENFYEELKRKL